MYFRNWKKIRKLGESSGLPILECVVCQCLYHPECDSSNYLHECQYLCECHIDFYEGRLKAGFDGEKFCPCDEIIFTRDVIDLFQKLFNCQIGASWND